MPKGPKTPAQQQRDNTKRQERYQTQGKIRRRKRAMYVFAVALLLSVVALAKPFPGPAANVLSALTVFFYAYAFFLLLW